MREVEGKCSELQEREEGWEAGESRVRSGFGFCPSLTLCDDWPEEKEECVKEGERRRRAGLGILFFLRQIDVIHLNHVTCAAHSLSDQRHATPKGNWNCIVVPHHHNHPHFFLFFSFFSFFFLLGNKRRSMCSILPRVWANKTTACSYMYRSPSSP